MADILGVLTGFMAVVLIFGKGVIRSGLEMIERVQMAKLQAKQFGAGLGDDQVAMLRAEIAQLRDTSTQHALSLQHSMERLDHRVEFLERKTNGDFTASAEAVERLQTIGRG